MTNDMQTTQQQSTEQKALSFGGRLKSAREAMGLDSKDAAAQLRLNEKFILMMEKESFPADLPPTFIKGYLRSYGKLVRLSDQEIHEAITQLKIKSPSDMSNPAASRVTHTPPVTSGNYFMQFFTYLIIITLVALVGMWWYNHPTETTSNIDIPSLTTGPQIPVPAAAPLTTSSASTPTSSLPSPQWLTSPPLPTTTTADNNVRVRGPAAAGAAIRTAPNPAVRRARAVDNRTGEVISAPAEETEVITTDTDTDPYTE